MALDDDVVKIIVIGDSMVGKTSFIQRYVNRTFRAEYKSTIGVDFALKQVQWTGPPNLKIQLWDIAGQERFTYMTRAYYKDAKACVLMFDLTSRQSFDKVVKWKADLDSKARLPDGSYLPCLLVGNKSDNMSSRTVTDEQISQLCEQLRFIGWTETSAKEGIMVDDAIKYLLDVVTGNVKNHSPPELTDSIRLKSEDKEKESKCFC